MNSLTVVILAAGLGTRMRSRRAKVLHRAGGLSLIEHVANTALELTAPERVVAVVGHQAGHVEQILAPRGVRFVRQTEQKGTGHAVLVCREMLEPLAGSVMVIYGDSPLLSTATLRQLAEQEQTGGYAAALITTTLDDPTGYGRILLDDAGNVRAIVEQRAATPDQLAIKLSNPGIYCFRGDLLWRHIGELEPDNPARELYLTDMVEIFRRHNHSVGALHVRDSDQLLGINTRVELAIVDRIFRERKARELMLSGVTIEKPETVSIDAQVSIGSDTIVEPFVQILGATRIGEDCRIGTGAIVRDCDLANGVEIGPYSILGSSRLEAGVHAGPFARLRMDNHVEAGAHIGNFVELKKTRLGAGAKAMHLAYLGDSDIGANVNVGAGAITCNYDGIRKHR
ncbi:MAG: bifunctional UDP-N-acetylglucosamine diphosphorylase/glucosamine-1-phosphate N-acetyltransferase GlmU, partial [Bryobacteraceae bacterium]